MRLETGNVRQFLLRDYAGDASTVNYLIALYGLPNELERPMYWQIPAAAPTRHRLADEQGDVTPVRERMRAFLMSIVSTTRIA